MPKKAKTANESPILLVSDNREMFSAASFAGVLSEYRADQDYATSDERQVPTVVAFYGFRGGAGRTTALAHVAALLSSRQVKVVAVDLDLEAPGLHHVLGCPEPADNCGVMTLLRAAATAEDEELDSALRLAPHLLQSSIDAGVPIRVIPAGRLTEQYLESLDDLGVPLWHIDSGPSPLEMLVRRVKEELAPDVICLDCRTGLSGLSASAVFHIADVVACFVPVSVQSLDGLGVLFKGIKAARAKREGRPDIVIVPAMVPEGPEGRARLEQWFIPEVEAKYAELVLPVRETGYDAEEISELTPIVREGIEYRRGIALSDGLRDDFVQRSSGAYLPLLRELDISGPVGDPALAVGVNVSLILEQLVKDANLRNLAFAESTDPRLIVEKFIQPSDFRGIVDRSTWYVVGAKGAGKTWLWQYLLLDVGRQAVPEVTFIAAHAPKNELVTPSAIREIERDSSVKLEKRQLYGAFWLFYAANRILKECTSITPSLLMRFEGAERRLIKIIARAISAAELQDALVACLAHERAGTFAEKLIRGIDAELLAKGERPVVLLYDGLDTGFGSDERAIDTRSRFVNALVEAIEPFRGATKRIGFKLFVREDLYSSITIQNQSHLSAATIELTWKPSDLWLLALNLAAASPAYLGAVRRIDPSAGPGQWPRDEERLRQLLIPLWGDKMEKGNKVSTARFVQRRTSDGKDRLFPRTLVQLLASAIEIQSNLSPADDRVLRSRAIIEGYNKASEERVADLRKEYVKLTTYLAALNEMKPTGTDAEIIDYLKKRVGKRKNSPTASGAKSVKGAPAGAEHTGPGGWLKVLDQLLEIGVLREYKRAKGDGGEKKYEIALLYRPGLGIKTYGV